ncbi:DUF5777 family beta-barrel protein [Sphingobacterium suaedae]|uniref:DUF5777 family beta-barrel protein n=1 Tax=Sphingobacterium suaedae TaxID=1686402 RepID=A0ABW5KL70_9SPHI
MKTTIILLLANLVCIPYRPQAQDLDSLVDLPAAAPEAVTATFKSGYLINAKTPETIHCNELDFRVDHRFGDIAGRAGGAKNFFGLDNSTDIRIGFDYGILDNLNVGLARAKGATSITQLYETNVKYRFLQQTLDHTVPVSIAFFGSVTASAMKASDDPTAASSFAKFGDRLTYVSQLIVARRFSHMFSFTMLPTFIHRNYTAFGDQNSLFAVGLGGRMRISNRIAVVADYFFPFRDRRKKEYREAVLGQPYYHALGVGLELETGGHIFHLNFTNATAIQESQFISETTSSWRKGQFRWGFSISRRFSFAKST